MSLLTLNNIRKDYPLGNQVVHAVKGVDFKIEKGEFAAITGPSGSGKSTILNMVGLIDFPTSGSIILEENPVYTEYPITMTKKLDAHLTALRRAKIGFIFQTFNLIPTLNVYENIEFPLLLNSKNKENVCEVDSFTKEQKEEWINYLIEKVGLVDWKTHKPNELSGGQRQRVAIARALVTKAPLILADEPTANLDSENSAQILSLMKQLNKELNTTFVFSTHDKRIENMCNHVIHIFDGIVKNDEYKEPCDNYTVEA
jgi:putative ABC transport system ATP-binding protein